MGEELSSVPLPMLVPIYHFDGNGGKGENDGTGDNKGEKELKYYNRKNKQEGVQEQDLLSHEPLQYFTLKPPPETGNVTISLPPISTQTPEN